MDITKKDIGVGMGVAAGVAVVAASARFGLGLKSAITQGGSPWGGAVNWFLARRSVIGFGVSEAAHGNVGGIARRFGTTLQIKRAEETVRTLENIMFYDSAKQVAKKMLIGYDNGPDAFRHTGASALISYRLIRGEGSTAKAVLTHLRDVTKAKVQAGAVAQEVLTRAVTRGRTVDVTEAQRLLKRVGDAHEKDSFLNAYDSLHSINSSLQDVTNNDIGSKLGALLAGRHATMGTDELAHMAHSELAKMPKGVQDALRALDPGEQLVMMATLDKVEQGVSVSMTPVPGVLYGDPAVTQGAIKGIHQRPHPAFKTDIFTYAEDGTRLDLRKMAPHAAGYPQPFAGGAYLPHADRVKMDIGAFLKVRRAAAAEAAEAAGAAGKSAA